MKTALLSLPLIAAFAASSYAGDAGVAPPSRYHGQEAPDPRLDKLVRYLNRTVEQRRADDKAEEERKAAEKAAAEKKAHEDMLAEARASKWCKAEDADEVCEKASIVQHKVQFACELIEDIKQCEKDAAAERKAAKKFGAVNVSELERLKERAGGYADTLNDTKAEIKELRKKPFSPKECK